MKYPRFFLLLVSGFLAAALPDALAAGELFSQGSCDKPPVENEVLEPEHAKIITMDATILDPGHVELDMIYSIQGGKFAWGSSWNRYNRREYVNHVWDMELYVGILKNLDIALFQGFARLKDRENNYNEVAGVIDPGTGEEMEDTTEGPAHGFGRGDLGIMTRWRFYHNEEKKLEIAYNPTLIIPTGRRSNLDHLGPSQGYTSLTNALVMTKDIGRFTGNFSAGYTAPLAHSDRTGNSGGSYDLNLGVGYQVFSWLQPELECLWAQEFEKHGKGVKIFSMVAGVLLPINDYVRVDLGVQQDIIGSNIGQSTSGIFKVILMT